jgi:hypothetical protein
MADSMLGNLKVGLTELLHNKKFLVGITSSLTAIIVRLAPKLGLTFIDQELANQLAMGIIILAATTIGAQGVADHGKEAAQVKANGAEPPAPPAPPPT